MVGLVYTKKENALLRAQHVQHVDDQIIGLACILATRKAQENKRNQCATTIPKMKPGLKKLSEKASFEA